MRQFDPWLASLSLVPGAGLCCNMVWDAGQTMSLGMMLMMMIVMMMMMMMMMMCCNMVWGARIDHVTGARGDPIIQKNEAVR